MGAGAEMTVTRNAAEFFAESGNPAAALMAARNAQEAVKIMRPSIDSYHAARGIRQPAQNAILSDKEWREIDQAVVQAAHQRTGLVQALMSANLTHPLGGWGVVESEYEAISEAGDATVSIEGIDDGDEDLPDRRVDIVPIPVVHKKFKIPARMLQASRIRGNGLDVTGAAAASQSVTYGLEDLCLSGASVSIGGFGLKGITNHGSIITAGTYTGGWGSATAAQMVADVIEAINQAAQERRYGPFLVVVPGSVAFNLEKDYSTATATFTTTRQRILAIEQVKGIVISDRLSSTDGTFLLELSRNTIDLAIGMRLSTVQWELDGGAIFVGKVWAAMAPRIKVDQGTGKTGIVKIG